MRLWIFGMLLISLSSPDGFSQGVDLRITLQDSSQLALDTKHQLERSYPDSNTLKNRLTARLSELRTLGYFTASFDTLRFHDTVAEASFHLGRQFVWGHFRVKNVPEEIEFPRGLSDANAFSGRPVHLKQFQSVLKQMSVFLKDQGYPFPAFRLKNIHFTGKDTVHADLSVESGERFRIDTIYQKGPARIHKQYLYSKLELHRGMLFSASQMADISEGISRIPFLKEQQPAEVNFSDQQRANIYLYLEKDQSNRASGIVGFQSGEENRLQLTGDFNLLLHNAFRRGEQLRVEWESFEEKSQRLDLGFHYPFLLFQRVGISLEGSLLKQDASYLTTDFSLGVPIQMSRKNELEFFGHFQNSSVIADQPDALGSFREVKKRLYGVNFQHNSLDYELNPAAGLLLDVYSSLGEKVSDSERSVHLESGLTVSWYKQLWKALVLKASLNGEYMNSWQDETEELAYSKNELFRLGGTKLLRGFQEQSFFASRYLISSLELRYLLGSHSNVFLFWDGGYYKNPASQGNLSGFPYGFGMGAQLDTGTGILSLSYAMGHQKNDPVSLENAKVHIGYITLF